MFEHRNELNYVFVFLLSLICTPCYPCSLQKVNVIDLSGTGWSLKNSNNSIQIPSINVPGVVYTHLYQNGIISDPNFRYNDVLTRWVAHDEWTYTTTFQIPSLDPHMEVIFEGLDTVSDVQLNGKTIGTSENMFVKYSFGIEDVVKIGENVLQVTFKSGISEAINRHKEYPYEVPTSDDPIWKIYSGERHRNFLRKEQASYGWDWGPSPVECGIWKPVYVVGFDMVYVSDVSINAFVSNGFGDVLSFDVVVELFAENVGSDVSLPVVVEIEKLGVKQTQTVDFKKDVKEYRIVVEKIKNAELWYPRGFGEAILYDIDVNIGSSQKITKKIGFRDVKVVQEPINESEKSFYVMVNGIKIYSKGANLIPLDSFEDRVSSSILENIIQSSIDANMNMLRVWGGGIYQSDEFYDLCDKNGIMVWQEMMFACSLYPVNIEFLNSVKNEVTYQMRRLKHHPSIILWSASNENEVSLWKNTWYPVIVAKPDSKPIYSIDYAKLYFDTVRKVVIKEDPFRFFWPSSPSNGIVSENPFVGLWTDPGSSDMGDIHYYNYLKRCDDVSNFPTGKFISEYGWQSYPSFLTWEKISMEEDWDWESDLMFHRQHHPLGNEQLLAQFNFFFREVDLDDKLEKFKAMLYLTQVMQVFCIQTETEYYRTISSTHHTMGALYWQLNSIWQAPTWSSLEYGGKWKMLHHAIKNSFAPILITSYYLGDSIKIFITNDVHDEVVVNVDVLLEMYAYSTGMKIASYEESYKMGYLESLEIFNMKNKEFLQLFNCSRENDCVLFMSAVYKNQTISRNTHHFVTFKDIDLRKPKINVVSMKKVDVRKVEIVIASDVLTPFVFVDVDVKGKFSDNGFFLFAGKNREIVFEGWEDIDFAKFQSTFTYKSIRDTYK